MVRVTCLFYFVLAFASCKKSHPLSTVVPIESARAAYVTDNGSDNIAVIDRDDAAIVLRSLDVDPSAHEAPHHLAIDAEGHVFVALAFPPDEKPNPQDKHAGHGRRNGCPHKGKAEERSFGPEPWALRMMAADLSDDFRCVLRSDRRWQRKAQQLGGWATPRAQSATAS